MNTAVFRARVWENAVVSGTGTVSLLGSAQPGYQAFSQNVPSGAKVSYCIYDTTTQEWETGFGIYTITSTPAGTLTRNFLESSSGSAVSFIGNTCNVTLDFLPQIPANNTGLYDISAGVPLISAGTQINIGGGTSTISITQNAGKSISVTNGATPNGTNGLAGITFSKASLGISSTPYLVAGLTLGLNPGDVNYAGVCIGFGQSSTGKFATLGNHLGAGLFLEEWSSKDTRSSVTAVPAAAIVGPVWIAIKDDGTNMWFYISQDGAIWYAVSNGTYASYDLTGAPDEIFIGLSGAGVGLAAGCAASFLCVDPNGLTRVVG